jgi:hypothetical protein
MRGGSTVVETATNLENSNESETTMDTPKEPTYSRLDEVADAIAVFMESDADLKEVWSGVSADERASIVRSFAIACLLFDHGGRRRLLDKLYSNFPQLQYTGQAAKLVTTAWLLGAATVLRYLRQIPDKWP